jgi:hypothetical protein
VTVPPDALEAEVQQHSSSIKREKEAGIRKVDSTPVSPGVKGLVGAGGLGRVCLDCAPQLPVGGARGALGMGAGWFRSWSVVPVSAWHWSLSR